MAKGLIIVSLSGTIGVSESSGISRFYESSGFVLSVVISSSVSLFFLFDVVITQELTKAPIKTADNVMNKKAFFTKSSLKNYFSAYPPYGSKLQAAPFFHNLQDDTE